MPSRTSPHPERTPKACVEGRMVVLQRCLPLAMIALLALACSAHAQQKAPPPAKAPAPPATAAAPAATIAVLQGLDKTTARVSTVEAPLDQAVHFGTLVITARACVKKPPEEPPNTAAFLEINEARASTDTQRLFSGWMFAQSPALSTLEHPVYDVTVLDCKTATGSSVKPPAK